MDANIESLENLKTNLKLNGLDPETVPLALQYNKQDLPDVATQEELDAKLNWRLCLHSIRGDHRIGRQRDAQEGHRTGHPKAAGCGFPLWGREAEVAPRSSEKAPGHSSMAPAPNPEEKSVPEPVRSTLVAKPALPEVELEEEHLPAFAEDDEMEAVEIETLQDVEPLPSQRVPAETVSRRSRASRFSPSQKLRLFRSPARDIGNLRARTGGVRSFRARARTRTGGAGNPRA